VRVLYFCLTPDFIFLRQAYDLVRSLLIVEEAPAPPGVPVPGPMADPRAGPRRYFRHPPLSDDSGPLGFGGPRGPSGSRPYQAPPAGATGQFGGEGVGHEEDPVVVLELGATLGYLRYRTQWFLSYSLLPRLLVDS
jgi:hypothetical protein